MDVAEPEEEEEEDPIDHISSAHAVLSQAEHAREEVSPALQDVLMTPSHLHLPGFEEVEKLALLLLELADDGDHHIIPIPLRQQITTAAAALQDHDKSARNFVKKYESKWGNTLFGRCLGQHSPQNSAAQKTKFGWMRYAQAAEITDESRLLYILIKMLKNRPNVSHLSSPTKAASLIKGQYKRIVDRIRDDPVLSALDIPLPNINAKSITAFMSKEEKKANYLATSVPKVPTHQRVLSDEPMPEAPTQPQYLPSPNRPQVQYSSVQHMSGRRPGEKRRLDLEIEELQPVREGSQPIESTSAASHLPPLRPKPPLPQGLPPQASGVPILLVVPSQPKAHSIQQPSSSRSAPLRFQPAPAPPPPPKRFLPNPSSKPCAACQVPKCGGLRKRYTPSKDKTEGSKQKIFTFCPATRKSTTPGFERVFDDYEHFKKVVDEELQRRKTNH